MIGQALRNLDDTDTCHSVLPRRLAADMSKIPFDTYSGYFVTNRFEPKSRAWSRSGDIPEDLCDRPGCYNHSRDSPGPGSVLRRRV